MVSSLILGSTNVIKISPNSKDRTDKAVKMKVNVITIELLNDFIASGNILPIPGIANTVSVITAPLMAKIIDAGIIIIGVEDRFTPRGSDSGLPLPVGHDSLILF